MEKHFTQAQINTMARIEGEIQYLNQLRQATQSPQSIKAIDNAIRLSENLLKFHRGEYHA